MIGPKLARTVVLFFGVLREARLGLFGEPLGGPLLHWDC